MDIDSFPEFTSFDSEKLIKTYTKPKKKPVQVKQEVNQKAAILQVPIKVEVKRQPLTSKNAVTFLLDGTLKSKVCRYCLHETPLLSELEQILQIATHRGIYKVTIKEIIANFYSVRVSEDKNFPNKICNKCLTSALSSYLFTQQCEQAERALRNYYEDVYEKLERLDPIERIKKRGRQKLHPNHNKIYVEHLNVIDYAEPLINLVNIGCEPLTKEDKLYDYECLKCCEVLPSVAVLLNHEKTHPKTMWFHCRLCGKAFSKRHQLKKHFVTHSKDKTVVPSNVLSCNKCDYNTKELNKYLQHIEKHRFVDLLQHITDGDMNRLCVVCMKKKSGLKDLDNMMCLQGGCPELSGNRTLYHIVSSTLPEMTTRENYTGTKICEKCLEQAIVAYVFINQFYFVRNRLNTFVTSLTRSLNSVDATKGNIFAEIPNSLILSIKDKDETYLFNENELIDERKLKIDILEDEFRETIKIDDESPTEVIEKSSEIVKDTLKPKLVNGYQNIDPISRVSEFLTFNKPKLKQKETYTCPVCYKKFISQYFLRRHLRKHSNRDFECSLCAKIFKSKFNFHEHIKNVHRTTSKPVIKCDICFRYVDFKKIRAHEKAHTLIQCVICTKTFNSFKNYSSHMQRHAFKYRAIRWKYYKTCSFCGKECASKNVLWLHVNKAHLQLKPYDCDMCEKQFYSEYNLKCHKKLHDLKSAECCQLCNKEFKCRRKLIIHIRKHLRDTPFSCEVCNQKFYSESETYNHMRKLHGGIFVCRFCKNVCPTKSRLKHHIQTSHNLG